MLQALLFTAISVLVSCVGLFLFQKFIAAEKIERNNESTGIYFGVITILYSLILAFSITSVWDDYEEINANVAREAQKLADIYSYSNQLQASAKVELKTAVRNYTIAVIDDIEKGNTKARAQIAHESFIELRRLVLQNDTSLTDGSRGSLRENYYELRNLRNKRLATNHSHVPMLLWWALIIGSVLCVFISWFIQVPSLKTHLIFTAAMSAIIAFMLFIGYALDHPFEGAAKISCDPLQELLDEQFKIADS